MRRFPGDDVDDGDDADDGDGDDAAVVVDDDDDDDDDDGTSGLVTSANVDCKDSEWTVQIGGFKFCSVTTATEHKQNNESR